MHTALVPVRSLDHDRLFTTTETDVSRLTPAERLTLRLGSWLVLRAAHRLEHTRAPLRHTFDDDSFVTEARDRVHTDAQLLAVTRTF